MSPVRATVAMTVAMLALSPVAAEAQPVGERAPSVVVRPGDSLWSISQERIGPNASPRRIMKGAERIHALNRSRIGADPDLLLVGQVLSVPWSLSGPPNGSPNGRPAREASEESQAQESQAQESQAQESQAQESQGAKMLRADPKAKVNLPEPHGAVLAPSARLAALKGTQLGALPEILSETSAGDRRRLLGLGIWALTLVLAAVVVALGHGA
ncbi:MAG: 3-ketoacyl-CoA thiolase, partial [uncultured Thermomicrobiales bacterium]